MKAPIDLLAVHLSKGNVPYERMGNSAIIVHTTDGVSIFVPKGVATMTSIHVATAPDAVSGVQIDEMVMPNKGAGR